MSQSMNKQQEEVILKALDAVEVSMAALSLYVSANSTQQLRKSAAAANGQSQFQPGDRWTRKLEPTLSDGVERQTIEVYELNEYYQWVKIETKVNDHPST